MHAPEPPLFGAGGGLRAAACGKEVCLSLGQKPGTSSLCPVLMAEASQGIYLYIVMYGLMPKAWVSWAWGG